MFLLILWSEKPQLFLLKTYKESMNISGMLMSEKLDGVRAFWDGKKLISRQGKVFAAPVWFTRNFPPFALDGELWTQRNNFADIVSIVNRHQPHNGWKKISYMIFEVPYAKGPLLERLERIKVFLEKYPNHFIKLIKQEICYSKKDLDAFAQSVQSLLGEGVVLRDAKANYHTKRSYKDLKVKPFFDAECKVVGYTAGKGKYTGKFGALKCEMSDKRLILIGSGFNDKVRTKPPEIGTLVTFKYYGKTKNALPRFPVYLRVRSE